MKFKPILLAVAVSLGLSACNETTVKVIETEDLIKNLDNPDFVIIDTRQDSLYNGFKDKNATRGGHIKGAVQFSCDWMGYIQPEKFEIFAAGKGMTKEKHLVFYDTDSDNLDCVTAEFATRGYKVSRFNDFISYANTGNPLESFEHFQYSVSPQWVNAALNGEKPETLDNDKVMLFEVSWGSLENAKAYTQHIVGAYHFNTDWVENGPLWNLSSPSVIEQNLLANGITKDKTIILYSDNQLAAYRVFWALKWAGVEDVRVLNGNLATWMDAGFPTETQVNIPQPEKQFGTQIPANSQIDIATPQEVIEAQKKGLKLISNRAWDEYSGKISGYDYIPGKGEPQGAIWGFAGTDSSNLADYYDPDGTLRNPKEIFALWQTQGIEPGDRLAFYCGTGWRASVSWFITQLAGWKNTVVYDGGWNVWQMDSQYPIQKGVPKSMNKPNSYNDFGRTLKKGYSCKS